MAVKIGWGSMAEFLLVSKCRPTRISAREPPDIFQDGLIFANLPISSYQAYVVCLGFSSVNSAACRECMSRLCLLKSSLTVLSMGLTILDHKQEPVKHGRMRLSTGVRLHYYTAGTGPALLLQHGIPKTSYYWRRVLPYLTPHYTCIVPDMRGIGDSTHPDTDYSMATVADDLAELMKKLSHEKFHIVGEDWGAAAAYQLAARHQDRVLSLVFQEMLLAGFGLEEWVRPPSSITWSVVAPEHFLDLTFSQCKD